MARRDAQTYRSVQRSREKVEAARRELEAQRELETQREEEREEPIHRYTFAIPQAVPASCPAAGGEEVSQALTRVLEKLQVQNQLLMDLLGAVNSLTAAMLCTKS